MLTGRDGHAPASFGAQAGGRSVRPCAQLGAHEGELAGLGGVGGEVFMPPASSYILAIHTSKQEINNGMALFIKVWGFHQDVFIIEFRRIIFVN